MLITLYSFKKIPIEYRGTFELPAWPYNKKHFKSFEKYMQDLSVFRYSDTELKDGKQDISAPIDFPFEPIPGYDKFPWEKPCYLTEVHVTLSELKVFDWPADDGSDRGKKLLAKIREHPIAKDMKTWKRWNVPVQILGYDGDLIKRIILEEHLDNSLTCKGKCYEAKLGKM